jgi:hypothetical protein
MQTVDLDVPNRRGVRHLPEEGILDFYLTEPRDTEKRAYSQFCYSLWSENGLPTKTVFWHPLYGGIGFQICRIHTGEIRAFIHMRSGTLGGRRLEEQIKVTPVFALVPRNITPVVNGIVERGLFESAELLNIRRVGRRDKQRFKLKLRLRYRTQVASTLGLQMIDELFDECDGLHK